jgi:hypothetical protein
MSTEGGTGYSQYKIVRSFIVKCSGMIAPAVAFHGIIVVSLTCTFKTLFNTLNAKTLF